MDQERSAKPISASVFPQQLLLYRSHAMGCGASSQAPPNQTGTVAKAAEPAKELILIIGLDQISGKRKLCESLCTTLEASGRHCQHLEVEVLLKADTASAETAADAEVAQLKPDRRLKVVRAALQAAPAGVYFLDGYPSSDAELNTLSHDLSCAPRLALLMDLTEGDASARLQSEEKLDAEEALQRVQAFQNGTRSLLTELEKRSLLHRIDVASGPEKCLMAASMLVDSVTRGTAGSSGDANAMSGRMVLIMGGPGAGKATHCARLASKYGCMHLHIEKLMRGAVKDETETGRAIAELVKGGKIVPAHLYLALLKGAMASQPNAGACLVDGFPRSVDSLALLEEHLGTCKRALVLHAKDATLEKRLLAKEQEAGRQEDVEGVRRRISTYKNQTLPAITTLEGRGVVSKVDANGSADEVFQRMCTTFEKLGLHKLS